MTLARALALVIVPLIGFLAVPALAADARKENRSGFYLSASLGSMRGPIFRLPSGFEEVAPNQSAGAFGVLAGYDHVMGRLAVGLRGSYMKASFQDFATPQMPGDQIIVHYADPSGGYTSADLLLHWLPTASGVADVYAYVALGWWGESYSITGSVFSEWNGSKSITEFKGGYGLGFRLRPHRRISGFAELRLIPGDKTYEGGDFLYSENGFDVYELESTYTAHTIKVFVAGVSVHF